MIGFLKKKKKWLNLLKISNNLIDGGDNDLYDSHGGVPKPSYEEYWRLGLEHDLTPTGFSLSVCTFISL